MSEAGPGPYDSSPETGRRFVFAGGCPRSGLTVLRALLAGHSRLACGPDTGLPPSIAFQWNAFATQLGTLHAAEFDMDGEAVRANMARLLTELIGEPVRGTPQHLLVEKTALNVVAFEPLAKLLPEARFIHVVREGRDVAASLLERDWRDSNGHRFAHTVRPDAALKYWSDLTGIGLKAEAALGPRIIRVRYEDLVTRPKAALTSLTRFLGLAWEPAMLHLASRDMALYGLEEDSREALSGPLSRKHVGRYKRDERLRHAPPFVGQRLEELGYG